MSLLNSLNDLLPILNLLSNVAFAACMIYGIYSLSHKKDDEVFDLVEIKKHMLSFEASIKGLRLYSKEHLGSEEVPFKEYIFLRRQPIEDYIFNQENSLRIYTRNMRIRNYNDFKKSYLDLIDSINLYRHVYKVIDFLKIEEMKLTIFYKRIDDALKNFIDNKISFKLDIDENFIEDVNKITRQIFKKCRTCYSIFDSFSTFFSREK